ncbi:MAG TPA: transglycosylase SLT domain-containing protein [Solirubrobacteraceae bacterium]
MNRSRPEPSSHPRAHSRSHHHPSPGGAPLAGGRGGTSSAALPGTTTPAVGVSTLSTNPPGFYGPSTWTGTVTEDPALLGALGNLSNLLANGNTPPGFLIPVYMEAGRRYNVPWEVLAAINAVESDYGRNLNTSSAGAIGWMQFEPSTWHQWGLAVDGHSVPNPYDPRDAIFSAARYLAAAGAATNLWGAVYAYNHASWYVNMVMSRARAIAATIRPERQSVRRGVVSVYFATYQRRQPTVRFRGGVLSHYVRLVAAANMVSAANFPYLWGGGHEQPARFAPFDCSGSVSYVIQQAGYRVPTTVSGDIGNWGFPRGPGRVTIFYNPTHTFMRIGNRYFGTSGFARPLGGGAGWFGTDRLPASYLAQFSEVHVPALGANSFSSRRRLRLRGFGRHRSTTSTRPQLLSALSRYPSFAHVQGLHL